MNKIKILELKKINEQYCIIYNKIKNYDNVCGVWAMFDDKGKMLEVAQTSNIFEELEYDLSWLLKKYSSEFDTNKRYSARRLFKFNQKFDVLVGDKNRTTAKYRSIAEKYNGIIVCLISNEYAESEDKLIREKVEMKIAIDNEALYWNAYGEQRKMARKYYAAKQTLIV